jgi:hypothetical protein
MPAGRPHTRATWYEPLEQQGDIDLAVWWALSRRGYSSPARGTWTRDTLSCGRRKRVMSRNGKGVTVIW